MTEEGDTAGPDTGTPVSVVAHTHWDREWYVPFETARLALVDLVGEVLDLLEGDPAFGHFLLDGQLSVVDDHVALRPDDERRIRALVGAGRLEVGPWYTLPDEFLVSGETLVRDLELGRDRAAALGGAMAVGYLPDSFGHVAQMPQLLAQFGFADAVVWRGVPDAVVRTAFWWAAPDGSTVHAEYLPRGYGVGADVPDDPAALLARVRGFDEEVTRPGLSRPGEPILWMAGGDHRRPAPHLGRVVAAADAAQDAYAITVTSLGDHLRRAPRQELPTWTGELRSGGRASLLAGVASNRVDVKQAAAAAARALEGRAEPLSALFLTASRWPAAPLAVAWREVVRNAAHDSVSACSTDEVVEEVLVRYHRARQIGDGLADRAVTALAAGVAHRGVVVVNPSAHARGGLVTVTVPGEVALDGLQVLGEELPEVDVGVVAAAQARQILQRELSTRPVAAVDVDERPDGTVDVCVRTDPAGAARYDSAGVRAWLDALAARRPQAAVRLVRRQPHTRTVLAHVGAVAPFGWAAWTPGAVDGRRAPTPVVVDANGLGMGNGLVRVDVDLASGTFALDGHRGLGRLVDSGDRGDTYTWCPTEDGDVVDRPDVATSTVLEGGPLRARLAVDTVQPWRTHVDAGGGWVGSVPTAVRTVLELRTGEAFVRVEVAFDHRSRDHRLRAWFPLPRPAATSRAECAFAVVQRGLDVEGGPHEPALPTFPSRRFVRAGDLTVAHDGLHEYELVDVDVSGPDGRRRAGALAVTLLRAVGWLSRPPMPTRPLPAGPELEVEGAQLQGRRRLRYAVAVGDVDAHAMATEAFVPLEVATAPGTGTAPPSGSALEVVGAQVSAVRRVAGVLEVRMFNPTPDAVTAAVHVGPAGTPARGWIVDLGGQPQGRMEGTVAMSPWAIRTVRIDEP